MGQCLSATLKILVAVNDASQEQDQAVSQQQGGKKKKHDKKDEKERRDGRSHQQFPRHRRQ